MTKHPIIPILALLTCGACVSAQCLPGWAAAGPSDPGSPRDFAIFDSDGPGPARPVLIGAGAWGVRPVDRYLVTRFDGRMWRRIGSGLGTVGHLGAACIAQTTGVGSPAPGLYVAGTYRRVPGEPSVYVSRWDGDTWNHIGETIGVIHSLAMFDEDGPGPEESNLFVGGSPFEVAGLEFPGVYRWDGAEPSLVGGGLQGTQFSRAKVMTMTIFDDDGPGPRPPALYVAGSFQTAGGLFVQNIARWDGNNWESLGNGLESGVDALGVFDDDGDGPNLPMLYAGGQFSTGVGWSRSQLSRWDGSQWSEVPGYNGGGVESLYVFDDDGDGPNKPALYVGGLFNSVNSVNSRGIIKWDGDEWISLDGGLTGLSVPFADALQAFDEDSDPATPPGLYVGGLGFYWAGTVWSPGLARWGCEYSTCYADCDASTGLGTLDLFDFLCFQNAFVAADPYACDCDTTTGPATCDLLDFLCFQRAFMAGCL